jgi:group I intron endonuclease
MGECGIYKIENKINGNVYIGQSIDIAKRFRRHIGNLDKNIHTNTHLQKAWSKYGKDNFFFDIIETCSKSSLNKREIFYIKEFKNETTLYNLTDGGDGSLGCKHTEETKRKLSEIHTGKSLSENHKEKIGEGNKGKIVSKETKLKMSAAMKGRQMSEEQKKKMSERMTGKPGPNCGKKFSEEYKKKLSESHKGYIAPNDQREKMRAAHIGRRLSEETKRKISESKKNISEETREKLRIAGTGKTKGPCSEEQKKKISEALKGRTRTEETKRKISETAKNKKICMETLKYE